MSAIGVVVQPPPSNQTSRPRGLDHIVHAVHDLDAAGAFYARLGFNVGSRNRHPFGTHNRVVQLHDFYIELLTVAEPEMVIPHAERAFSFSAFQQDYLAREQGLSMLMLSSADAVEDAHLLQRSGIGDFAPFDFGRDGLRADGTPVKLAFSLAFARDPASPRAGFGVCHHHYPENFWNDAAQCHDNRASEVLGAVLIADNPTDHHIFLGAYTGLRDLHSSSIGIAAQTARGEIEIVEPVSFRDRFGVRSAPDGEGASFAALRIAVDGLDALHGRLRENGIECESRVGGVLVVPPQAAFGATLVFEPRGRGDKGPS